MPDDPPRWTPSRAGILNVYQYQDEVLEFADGRLLLRGVNGSGKSTAMNMLLPFLLEADVRKIDAAGEQRGVLRSWMLSDNDDTQRTGYLWIEFVRAGRDAGAPEYRTVGCGIRANRSTDRVTTWWFSTDRRARHSGPAGFRLTEAEVPFSADALRSELGPHGQVFTSTSEYRAEVARRFFGGTDPSAYFRLLHQVRNPRVGDRIDTDLPRTLREALPPVPEDAVSDAAQPLEDLEDHRRNVTDLERTAAALDGVVDTYAQYARRVLAASAEVAEQALGAARKAAARLERDRAAADRAVSARATATAAVTGLSDDHAAATAELAGLKALPEYSAHADLVRRQEEFARAEAHTATLDGHRSRALERVRSDVDAVGAARGQLDSDLAGVAARLDEVRTAARTASAPVRLPDPPALVVEPREDAASGTTVEVPEGAGDAGPDGSDPAAEAGDDDPGADPDPVAELDGALVGIGDALRAHRTTVRGLREQADRARDQEGAADRAEENAAQARDQAGAAREQASVARRAAVAAGTEHAEAVQAWGGRLVAHVGAVPPAEPDGVPGWMAVPRTDGSPDGPPADPSEDGDPTSADDLRRAADRRRTAARHAADEAAGELSAARTRAQVRTDAVAVELEAHRAEHTRVEAATELPLPRATWRRDTARDGAPAQDGDRTVDGDAGQDGDADLFASLVDFRDGLPDADRAGIEAALEASGLLAARVAADGTVVDTAGELIVRATAAAAPGRALDGALVPVDTGAVPAATVAAVLAAVGSGPDTAAVWVDVDGRFGAGPLRGRHAKPAAEYVGAGARAQARARRLAELTALIDDAEHRLAAERAVVAALGEHAEGLRRLVRELPSGRAVDDAVAAAAGAQRYADEADQRHETLEVTAAAARRTADEAWARLGQTAAGAGLPTDPERLADLLDAITDAERALAGLESARERVGRTARAWREAIRGWRRDTVDHAGTAAEHRTAAAHARSVRTELTTVADALGEEPAKVAARVGELDDRLRDLAGRVETAREEATTATVAVREAELRVEQARDQATARDGAARDARRRLVDTVEVPGLLAAAVAPAGTDASAADRVSDPSGTPSDPVDRAATGPSSTPGPSDVEPAIGPELPATPDTVEGAAELVAAVREVLVAPTRDVGEDALEKTLRTVRDQLAAGWDIESRRAADGAPLAVHVNGPTRAVLVQMVHRVAVQRRRAASLLSAQQDQALRNLLHGRIAREVADALFAARELVDRMNRILRGVTSSQGIGVRLDWRPRGDLDPATATAMALLGKHPDLRSEEEDARVREAVHGLVEQARRLDPEASYRSVIGEVLDYRTWHEMRIYLRRPGRNDELLTRRTTLSEGEKKLVTVLPMAAAAAASAAAHDPHDVGAPRLVLLDDAFAKVSEDNHAKLFGLLVDLDVDFVVTSERLWGTHENVPALAITEVLRDPELKAIALVHYRWDGATGELSVGAGR